MECVWPAFTFSYLKRYTVRLPHLGNVSRLVEWKKMTSLKGKKCGLSSKLEGVGGGEMTSKHQLDEFFSPLSFDLPAQ